MTEKQRYISFIHSLTNYNRRWLGDLAFKYRINTNRNFSNFTNSYYFVITIKHSIFFTCTFYNHSLYSNTANIRLNILYATNGWNHWNKCFSRYSFSYAVIHDFTEYARYQQQNFVFGIGWDSNAEWWMGTSHCYLAILSITTDNCST
jgi:hypothetical protein